MDTLELTVQSPSTADREKLREEAPIASLEPAEMDEAGQPITGDWRVKSLSELEWALSKLAETLAEKAEAEALAAEWKRRVETRLAGILRPLESRAAFFRAHIESFADAHRGELLRDKKKKSRTFIAGTVGWRAKAEKLVITDPAALEAWLLATDVAEGLYRMKIEPEKKALNDRFKASGEIPPGMDVEPSTDTFFADPVSPTAPLAVKE